MKNNPLNDKEFIIRKVPLSYFIKVLTDVFQSGADFVDLHGVKNVEALQDEITLSVPISYMSPSLRNDIEETPVEEMEVVDEEEITTSYLEYLLNVC